MGLIRMGWRADAVKLMGRWDSEAVRRYTRSAALHAPTDLAALIVQLCGVPLTEVPPPAPTTPEPEAPAPEEWILNAETDMHHLFAAEGRARCGWNFTRSGIRGSPPPPWHFAVCSSCAPALRRRLKAQARAAGEHTRAGGMDE